jgi:RimJ/RimL family protein N-acetyltransferase
VRSLQIPTLEGTRVRLEPLAREHAPGMFALWRQPEVCEYAGGAVDTNGLPIELPAATQAASDRLLQFWLDRASAGTGFRWAVVAHAEPEFIGAVGFNALGPTAEYAYHVSVPHWGQGLASEASRLALAWVFSSGTESVDAYVLEANVRSAALAKRLGFRASGTDAEGLRRWVLPRPPAVD